MKTYEFIERKSTRINVFTADIHKIRINYNNTFFY